MKRRLVPAIALCLAPWFAAAPACAASGGSVAVPNIVLYDGCDDQPLTYSVVTEPGYSDDVTLYLSIVGPDGLEAASEIYFNVGASGSDEFFFCGDLMAGMYYVGDMSVRATSTSNATSSPWPRLPSRSAYRRPGRSCASSRCAPM